MSNIIRRRTAQAGDAASGSSLASSSHPYSTTSKEFPTTERSDSQSLRLDSGRTLGYATYGPEKGFPLLFFHGFPSSRLEAYVLRETAEKRNIRIISVDRPGFGLSSFQPGRRFTDWPSDVAAVVHHLGLRRYSVLGASGGGPFALACAHALPKEQLASVGLFASAGPWTAGTQDLPRESRALGWMCHQLPRVTQGFMTAVLGVVRWMLQTRFVTRRLDRMIEQDVKKEEDEAKAPSMNATEDSAEPLLKTKEQQDIRPSVAERRKELIRMLLEAFTQGMAGPTQEAQLLSLKDWGFRFEDVHYDTVRIWHGTKDSRSPIGQIRYMAQHLPHAQLIEFDEEGHFDMAKRMEQALDELIPADAGNTVK